MVQFSWRRYNCRKLLKIVLERKNISLRHFEKPFQQVLTTLYFIISITEIKIKNVSIIQRYSSCSFNQVALSPQLQETSDLFYFVFSGFSLEWNQTHVFFHVLFLLLKIILEFIHSISHFSSAFSCWTLSHRMNILLFLYSVTYWQLFEIFWLKATPSEAPESTQLHISE